MPSAALRKGTEMSHNSPSMLAPLAHAYGSAGNKSAADKVLVQILDIARKQYVSPYYLAIAYEGAGRNEEALGHLEKAFEDHSNGMVFLKVEPQLDALRSSPRFMDLQRKMNFPE